MRRMSLSNLEKCRGCRGLEIVRFRVMLLSLTFLSTSSRNMTRRSVLGAYVASRMRVSPLDTLNPHRSLEYKALNHSACSEQLKEIMLGGVVLDYRTDEDLRCPE